MNPIIQLMMGIIVATGTMTQYDVNDILNKKALPNVWIVGNKISKICGSKRHLGCYSASSNVIVLKKLDNQNLFDYAIFAHEIFHHVQYHNGKRTNIEPEAYRFESRFKKRLRDKSLIGIEITETDKENYLQEMINARKYKR